ncbi:hypothetical protein DYB32_008024 [Aphanomyces invadans]|uniref:DDE-1 domain-containing protein n=1 Tax=Aphanomyces invadans TaxID=157072 RepID=A0A418AMT7_9STRA|nr:hypothetical protein DYB32_008024 [Aphanomyces invadans]
MCAGENSYTIPLMKKVALKKCGRVPEPISCGQDVFDTGCALLAQQDLVAVMRDLAIQTQADLEMSDILTALETVDLDEESVDNSYRKAATELSVPYSSVRNWSRVTESLLAFKGNKKSTNLPGAGRPAILPEPSALLDFMNSRRQQERALTCTHMINFLRKRQHQWLSDYIARQKEGRGYDHLLKLLQEFCGRNGYTHQQACLSKRVVTDLESTRIEFVKEFHAKHGHFKDDCVYNVDETSIHCDMPPRYIRAQRGGSSKLSKGEKHSYRMTALLTIRRDGIKLPIHFVIRGQVGGRIDTQEVPSYPAGHYYAMQSKAWMDSGVWQHYLWWFLAVTGKSLLVLDNFESHVCPLLPNATSHCQPLDVSVMAPFKKHLRYLWIAEDLVSSDDDTDDDWMSPRSEVKRITMIERAIQAWDLIIAEQVRASFLKAIPKC